jgi:hypothetical protein
VADITVSVSSPGVIGFGQDNFGAQNFGGENLSATFSVGGVQFVFDTGWGSNDWGELTWGVAGNEGIATGLQLDVFYGLQTVKIDVDASVQGQQLAIISPATKTSGIQNVSGTSDNILFAFRPNEASKIQYVGPGWNVVGQPTFIVTAVSLDPNDQYTGTITITGGTFVSGQTYEFQSPNVTTQANANVTEEGIQLNTQINSVVIETNTPVSIQGSQINLTEGEVTTDFQPDAGWGVAGWGVVPWGLDNDIIVPVTGTALSVVTHPVDINADGNESVSVDEDDDIVIYLNNVTTTADANVNVTGSRLNITEGLNNIIVQVDVIVPVTGTRINTIVGIAIGGTIQEVPVTGSQINLFIGNENTSANANVNVTGSRINLTPGQVTYEAAYDVTGSRVNLTVGQATTTGNAVVNVTGSRLNISAGSASTVAWAEVQTGAINTWTPVDLAA